MSLTTRWASIVGVVIVEKETLWVRTRFRRHHHLAFPTSQLCSLDNGHLSFFLSTSHSLCLVHLPLLPVKNMTAIIDRAADRIRDDDLLADKKRVNYLFPPSHAAAHPSHLVRVLQTRWSLSCSLLSIKQETFSFTFPFSQRFILRLNLILVALFFA